MAFRKRNAPVINAANNSPAKTQVETVQIALPGTRPSPLAAVGVTSTGTKELDNVLGGHGGLVQGSSLLVGEHGTTDYGGALLRAYAAEGLLQGHEVHLIALDKSWIQNLPGVAADSDSKHEKAAASNEKMKIAWRYENSQSRPSERVTSRSSSASSISTDTNANQLFCHSYDLTKRLEQSPNHKITYYPIMPGSNILHNIIQKLNADMSARPSAVHRIVIPSFLSPAYYPLTVVNADQILQFIHALQALLSKHSERATAMISLPLSLYPRTTGMVRWMEQLASGVLEMLPFPYLDEATTASEKDKAQGLLRILKLPLTTDRGEGGAGTGNTIGDDLAFTLSRKKFVIEPFSLPPMEGDQEAQKEAGKTTARDVEF